DVAGEGSACGLCAWELTVHAHFGGGGAGASVAAGDHQSVGARFAHRRVLVRAGEAVRAGPGEAAVAAALEHYAGDVAGEGSRSRPVTLQERVPPAACAPGSSLSMPTSAVAVLVHPLLPVTTKV